MFNDEKREQKKIRMKPSISALAEQLATELFAVDTVFLETKAGINDVLERLIVLEASKYNLLPEDEFQNLLKIMGKSTTQGTAKPKEVPQEQPSLPPQEPGELSVLELGTLGKD